MKGEERAAGRWLEGQQRSGRWDFLRVGGAAEGYRKRLNQEVETLSGFCRKKVLNCQSVTPLNTNRLAILHRRGCESVNAASGVKGKILIMPKWSWSEFWFELQLRRLSDAAPEEARENPRKWNVGTF